MQDFLPFTYDTDWNLISVCLYIQSFRDALPVLADCLLMSFSQDCYLRKNCNVGGGRRADVKSTATRVRVHTVITLLEDGSLKQRNSLLFK